MEACAVREVIHKSMRMDSRGPNFRGPNFADPHFTGSNFTIRKMNRLGLQNGPEMEETKKNIVYSGVL